MKTQLTIPMPINYVVTYNLHFIGVCLLFITACSLFKEKSFYQTDSLRRIKNDRAIKMNRYDHIKMIRLYTRSDSAEKQYVTEIYPKGFFNYSPENGFSGEAERVVLKGKVKEGILVRDSGHLSQESNIRSDTKEVERAKMQARSKEKKVKTKNTRLEFVVGGVVLVGVLIFVFGRFSLNFLR